MSNKHVIATLVIAGMIGMVATAFALASMNFIPAASAVKDTRCAKHTQGGGNPHDAENPHNPHDTQLGFNTGNPHDACVAKFYIQHLAAVQGFDILWIREEYEEPVTLYLVSSRKT